MKQRFKKNISHILNLISMEIIKKKIIRSLKSQFLQYNEVFNLLSY